MGLILNSIGNWRELERETRKREAGNFYQIQQPLSDDCLARLNCKSRVTAYVKGLQVTVSVKVM